MKSLYWLSLVLACVLGACSRADKPQSGSTASAPAELLPVGSTAPAIEVTAHDGMHVSLAALKGKPVVLYFYPKDDTPGCTKEACEIRDAWQKIQETGAVVLGVSTDDNTSHVAFAQKYQLPFMLLPDTDEKIAKAYGVPIRMGHAKRVTFIIDRQGKIAKVFPDVNPAGHAGEIIAALTALRT
ncbi:MAG TPA: peroxiredoxin [Polyangiaceae bacterium]